MLVRFTTETGTVDYLESVASTLLKAMGNSGKVPGAIRAEDVGKALAALVKATSNDDASSGDDEDESISLHNRAFPLLKLLQRAVDNGEYVMWDHST